MPDIQIQSLETREKTDRLSGLAFCAYLVICLWAVYAGQRFLVPICIAALLSFLVFPLIRFLMRCRVPEPLAITLGSLLLIVPLVGACFVLVRETQNLIEDFPKILATVEHALESFSNSQISHRLHLEHSINLEAFSGKIGNAAGSGAAFVLASVGNLLSAVSLIVLVLIFTILMIASRKHLRLSAEKLLSRFENLHGTNMLVAVTSLIEQFLIARALITLIMSVACSLVLLLFGVPYSFLLGSFIGVLTSVPEIGYLVSIIPVIVVALVTGHTNGQFFLLMAVLFAVHLVESNVLSPKMVGHKLNINLLASFIGLFGGGLLWGVWGMFLSVPILGIVRIILCASPEHQVWGELLAEREDKALQRKLIRREALPTFFRNRVQT